MLINEIEITGSSFSTVPLFCDSDSDAESLFNLIMAKADMFSLETEIPGFHDCDFDGDVIRGYYSHIEPFEIEHLLDGVTTRTLFKRIKSCQFIGDGTMFFAWEDAAPRKLLSAALSALTGNYVETHGFEFEDLNRIQNKMTRVKSVAISNPKDKEVRRCRMSGYIEEYTEYNVLDPRNHGLESVAGLIDTPLGPMTFAATSKGVMRLNVKKGMILTFDCLKWIFELAIGKHEGVVSSCYQPTGECSSEETPCEESEENENQPKLPFGDESDSNSQSQAAVNLEQETSSDGP